MAPDQNIVDGPALFDLMVSLCHDGVDGKLIPIRFSIDNCINEAVIFSMEKKRHRVWHITGLVEVGTWRPFSAEYSAQTRKGTISIN